MRARFEIGKVGSALAAALAVVSLGTEARAFERQWHVGVDAGHAALFESGVAGFGGGVHAAYGVSDVFNLMLELDMTKHPGGALTRKTPATATSAEIVRSYAAETVASGAVGIAYTLDIARAVPYAGILVAGYRMGDLAPLTPAARAGDLPSFSVGGQFALGLDYEIDRHWAIGAQFRLHTIFMREVGTLAYATTFLRFEYLWGF